MLRSILQMILMTALMTVAALCQPPEYLSRAVRAPLVRAAGDAPDAPNVSFKGPLLGFAFDTSANRFVSFQGIPGAATTGMPLLLSQSLQNVEIAPNQDFAVAVAGSEMTPVVVSLGAVPVAVASIPGARLAPTRVFLSPRGSAGLLYYQADNKLQVVTGLPSSPAIAADLSDSHSGIELSAAAVSDDGAAVLLALWDGHTGSLYRLNPDGTEDLAWSAGRISAATFLAGTSIAMAADQDNSTVNRFELAAGAVQTSVVADSSSGLTSPQSLASSADNLRVFALNKDETVTILDLTGGASLNLSCSCQPNGLHRLAGNDVFRLTDPSGDPTWVLAAGMDPPRVVFIPPAVQPQFQIPTPVRVTQ